MDERPSYDLLGRKIDARRRNPNEARSSFERWILKSGGTGTIAKALGISQATIVHWCNRKTTPSLELAVKMVELAKGELSYEDILEGTKTW